MIVFLKKYPMQKARTEDEWKSFIEDCFADARKELELFQGETDVPYGPVLGEFNRIENQLYFNTYAGVDYDKIV